MSKNDIVPRSGALPALSRSALDCLPDLVSHSSPQVLDIFRTDTAIMRRDTEHVIENGRYLDARINQIRKAQTLIQERISTAALIADMENALIEIQRAKDHERYLSHSKRNAEQVTLAYDNRIAIEKKEAELARAREAHIRAQRNCDAAERVAPVQADQWYAEAEARRSNAYAERQDAAHLARGTLPDPSTAFDAATKQRELDLQTIEHQIELERERGNSAAVLALANLRARLKVA